MNQFRSYNHSKSRLRPKSTPKFRGDYEQALSQAQSDMIRMKKHTEFMLKNVKKDNKDLKRFINFVSESYNMPRRILKKDIKSRYKIVISKHQESCKNTRLTERRASTTSLKQRPKPIKIKSSSST